MDLDFLLQLELIRANINILIQEFELFKFNPTQTWNDTFQDWDKSQFIQVFGPDNLIKIDINLHQGRFNENSSSFWATFKEQEFKNRKESE